MRIISEIDAGIAGRTGGRGDYIQLNKKDIETLYHMNGSDLERVIESWMQLIKPKYRNDGEVR